MPEYPAVLGKCGAFVLSGQEPDSWAPFCVAVSSTVLAVTGASLYFVAAWSPPPSAFLKALLLSVSALWPASPGGAPWTCPPWVAGCWKGQGSPVHGPRAQRGSTPLRPSLRDEQVASLAFCPHWLQVNVMSLKLLERGERSPVDREKKKKSGKSGDTRWVKSFCGLSCCGNVFHPQSPSHSVEWRV